MDEFLYSLAKCHLVQAADAGDLFKPRRIAVVCATSNRAKDRKGPRSLMRMVASTLDDLCRKVLPKLLTGADATNTSRGLAHERRGVLLELKNPRARLSRTETRGRPFSCLGELLWYLSRDNRLEFIEYYLQRYRKESEDGETVHGGYGRRLFGLESHDQVATLIANLRLKPNSRRAVLLPLLVSSARNGQRRPLDENEVRVHPLEQTLPILIADARHSVRSHRSKDG